MAELGDSLERMTFMQLLILFAFVASYVLALGGMLGAGSRLRAALLALALAVAFTALTDPWVHGALLMIFVIAGLGLFVLLSWLLARFLAPRPVSVEPATDMAAETQPSQPEQPLPGESATPAHKMARGARATR
jgi:hypothetical protein